MNDPVSTPDGRPVSDGDQLREAAAWLDTLDLMAREFFNLLQRSAGSMPEEMRLKAVSLIPSVSSTEVQDDLRRIAADLDAGCKVCADREADALARRPRTSREYV